jgi:hypothetical protein
MAKIESEGNGTRLKLVHDGLTGLRGILVKQFMGAGWKRMFDERIPRVLLYAKQHGWGQFPKDRRPMPADCDA